MTQPTNSRSLLVDQLRNLASLQEVDLQIEQLKKKKAAMPVALKALETEALKLQTEAAKKQAAAAELKKLLAQVQAGLDMNQDRLVRSSQKLDAVKTTQEFQAANREVEQIKRSTFALEEQKKKLSSEIETAEKAIEPVTEQLKALQDKLATEAATMQSEIGTVEVEMSKLMESRKPHLEGIEVRILSQYDRVRMARGGLGLSPASGGRCAACNMVIAPQIFNELQRGTTLHTCTSCFRILFLPQPAGAQSSLARDGQSLVG